MQAVYGSHTFNLSQKLRFLVRNVSVILLMVSLVTNVSVSDDQKSSINIATASNFLLPLKYLKTEFEQQYSVKVKITAASTAKLYAQILNGAPYDVFLAADDLATQKLLDKGFAKTEDEFRYAQGSLVLWSAKPKYLTEEALRSDFINTEFQRLALANPKTAPYGRAATEVLGYYKVVVPKTKLVLGESVGQAYQIVSSGNVDMGFVAYSQIKSFQVLSQKTLNSQKGQYWILPRNTYRPIYQHGVLLGKENQKEGARQFMYYLQSQQAQEKLRQLFNYL